MARKPALSIETLTALGAEKLARLVLDEAERSAPFRKVVSAALAGQKGPDAIARIVDRCLGALETARGFIDWDKARAFRDDLAATVTVIANELADASPAMAFDRLLRFIATHESVFERVDDSSSRIQDVYHQAIDAAGALTPKLAQADAAELPARVMAVLGNSSHGYLVDVAQVVAEHLPKEALRTWDADLAARQRGEEAKDAKAAHRHFRSNASRFRATRQIIADSLGDLDGLIALEAKKHPNLQDTIGMATRLLEASRAQEALDWIRRPTSRGLTYLSAEDLADGLSPDTDPLSQRSSLEAKILEALGRKNEAQALRWSAFEATLHAGILREYLAALPDFEDFATLDRAFAHVLASEHIYNALAFLVEWPRLDLAARLVVERRGKWDGRQYDMLPPVADALAADHPLAATILYRALLDDILARARSKAYPHAARYLGKLDELAAGTDTEAGVLKDWGAHDDYRAGLEKAHGRKSGFWSLVQSR
ncbi:DUF6880 family protein [Xanthobacter sp. AM11]|uniref:DUF6880 family protein n=1 Tax=Xanthobacter sp. AM11 TaxID=3380643 RepID=UPI0039BFBE6F